MREIKFRGKRLDNGEWIEGDLLRMLDHWFIFPDPAPEGIDKYAVDPATVGEYTGLKDKNGKEIYEGDIVKWDECVADYRFITQIAEVSYNKSSASFEPLGEYCYESFEVIGNIHDNPEFLKGGGQ